MKYASYSSGYIYEDNLGSYIQTNLYMCKDFEMNILFDLTQDNCVANCHKIKEGYKIRKGIQIGRFIVFDLKNIE